MRSFFIHRIFNMDLKRKIYLINTLLNKISVLTKSIYLSLKVFSSSYASVILVQLSNRLNIVFYGHLVDAILSRQLLEGCI